jgi:hypothetical protein
VPRKNAALPAARPEPEETANRALRKSFKVEWTTGIGQTSKRGRNFSQHRIRKSETFHGPDSEVLPTSRMFSNEPWNPEVMNAAVTLVSSSIKSGDTVSCSVQNVNNQTAGHIYFANESASDSI